MNVHPNSDDRILYCCSDVSLVIVRIVIPISALKSINIDQVEAEMSSCAQYFCSSILQSLTLLLENTKVLAWLMKQAK